MENKNLIPLSVFVLEQKKRLAKSGWRSTVENSLELIFNYTEFLKQPLKLEMFVPCDENGNILENPFLEKGRPANGVWEKYKEAKEKVLFEGFEVDFMEDGSAYAVSKDLQIVYDNTELYVNEIYSDRRPITTSCKVIEDLTKYDLTLTPSALNKIGIKE